MQFIANHSINIKLTVLWLGFQAKRQVKYSLFLVVRDFNDEHYQKDNHLLDNKVCF